MYSGTGGWSLGLKLNDIEVIKSLEIWEPAVKTSNKNFNRNDEATDIRKFDFRTIKDKVDIVVGSPPCTQFSYSNKGGSGDLDDGIIDLYKFFECVSILKPKFWAMENVPRVKKVIFEESKFFGKLSEFSNIINNAYVEIFDLSEFGLPQKRKRCIASNVDFALLNSYKERCKKKSLKDVLNSFRGPETKDINYDISMAKEDIFDLEKEPNLNEIEIRKNLELKRNHFVYGKMSFPDDINQPARTIMATCTRTSREGIIVKDKGNFRRLSLREKASAQGFPINFNFYADSHSAKTKMIGNAIPPTFTYALAAAMKGISQEEFIPLEEVSFNPLTNELPKKTPPPKKTSFQKVFRYTSPGLNLGSQVRFDLSNKSEIFNFKFYYGNPKNIHSLNLDEKLYKALKTALKDFKKVNIFFEKDSIPKNLITSSSKLQKLWEKQSPKGPFKYLDDTDKQVRKVLAKLNEDGKFYSKILEELFHDKKFVSEKIKKNSKQIVSGLIVCSSLNKFILNQQQKN